MIDLERLRRSLGAPSMAWLLERLNQRLEVGKPLAGRVSLQPLGPEQREAVEALFGWPPGRGPASLKLEELERVLREAGVSPSLAEAVEALRGPVVPRKARRLAEEAAWAAVYEGCDLPAGFVEELRAKGLLRRLARGSVAEARRLLAQARDLLARLPARGIPLAELAAQVAGDGHALDRGTPLGTLAHRLVGRHEDGWRSSWASVGVLCDELSAPVLVLNLPTRGRGLVDRLLDLHAEAGEPARVTLRQLVRHAPTWQPCRVHVCENPSVVAAAAHRLGAACAPLVCVDGEPKPASRVLLDGLRSAGAEVLYHGDFDWPGVAIANRVLARHGARPWRMGRADYEAAAVPGCPLEGPEVLPTWDPELGAAMRARGEAVHEEAVLGGLLGDLG